MHVRRDYPYGRDARSARWIRHTRVIPAMRAPVSASVYGRSAVTRRAMRAVAATRRGV